MYTSPGHQLLDVRRPATDEREATDIAQQPARNTRRAILCAHCHARISDTSRRIEVAGAHRHTFFNPAGVVFQVLCFSAAPGCRGIGPFSAEFTWFAGHRWQIGICSECQQHLGWQFAGDSQFVALIERQIVEY